MAEVKWQRQIAPDTMHLRLFAPQMTSAMQPGQFVHLRVQNEAISLDPLLRRPLSLTDFDTQTGCFDLIYQVVGRGTLLLSQRLPGEKLDVMGPIGKPFPLPETERQKAVLVAGGVGAVPLYALAKELRKRNCRVILFLGARTAAQLLLLAPFQDLGVECFIFTDDGSAGTSGRVTDNLRQELAMLQADLLYACGPAAMLRALHPIVIEAHLRAWLSLENHMACGIGACLGCTVKLKEGDGFRYALLCQEGPVFAAKEVLFDV